MSGPVAGTGNNLIPDFVPNPWAKPATVQEAEQNWADAREQRAGSSGVMGGLAALNERVAHGQYMEAVEREYGAMPPLRAGGSAEPSDVTLAAEEMAKMPEEYRQMLKDNGQSVVVCRDSVTDHMTELQGVQPRGWPPGATWDSVPGLYNPEKGEIVVATTGHDTPGGARIPQTGEGHGSTNLLLHEAGHAVHHIVGDDPAFIEARNADYDALSDYERQPGAAGVSETFAESFANVFGGNPTYSTTHPRLDDYWRNG